MEGFKGMPQMPGNFGKKSHTGRNVFVVIAAVALIGGAGVFFFMNRPAGISGLGSPAAPQQSQQKPITTEQKAQLLQVLVTSSTPAASTTPTKSEREKVLNTVQPQGAPAAPPPSSADKAKLLQSLQN